MASIKVKAIVIGGTNVKEKDRQVRLFTLENGKMQVSMKGVRGEKAKMKAAKEPFCFGEYIIEQTSTSNIVTGVDIVDNFFEISKDIDKYYEACAMLDVVDKVSTSQANPQLFLQILKALKTICYENVKKYYCIDKFMLNIFAAMGYKFMTDVCSSCGGRLAKRFFNFEYGEIVCTACKNDLCDEISDACYSALRLFENTTYEKLSTLHIGGMGEMQAYNLLAKNFNWRTGFKMIEIP